MKSETVERTIGEFASERRRVISTWRVLILLRRFAHAAHHRLPGWEEAESVVRSMRRRRWITRVGQVHWMFRIDAPFARVLPLADEHILLEAHPAAALSHASALFHHQMTDTPPRRIHVTDRRFDPARIPPCGTLPEDWVDLDLPINIVRRLRRVGDLSVDWRRVTDRFSIGYAPFFITGVAVYMSDIEQTLIDGLRSPDRCGGIGNVFAAWRRAAERINLDRLIGYIDRVDSPILRQRAGYLIEAIGLSHQALERWQDIKQRGSTLRLLPGEPFDPTYSERWNLSLNAPSELLSLLEPL